MTGRSSVILVYPVRLYQKLTCRDEFIRQIPYIVWDDYIYYY